MLEGIISKILSILGSGLPSGFSNVIPRGPGFDNRGSTLKGSGLYNRAKQTAYHQTNFQWAFFTDKHFSNSYIVYVAIYTTCPKYKKHHTTHVYILLHADQTL